jgi:hypothetical protein
MKYCRLLDPHVLEVGLYLEINFRDITWALRDRHQQLSRAFCACAKMSLFAYLHSRNAQSTKSGKKQCQHSSHIYFLNNRLAFARLAPKPPAFSLYNCCRISFRFVFFSTACRLNPQWFIHDILRHYIADSYNYDIS